MSFGSLQQEIIHKNINCKGMVDMMYEVQVISCYTISTQLLENIDKELPLNVVECMFTLYLRVRSFSYVRELAAEKKKEKTSTHQRKGVKKGFENSMFLNNRIRF